MLQKILDVISGSSVKVLLCFNNGRLGALYFPESLLTFFHTFLIEVVVDIVDTYLSHDSFLAFLKVLIQTALALFRAILLAIL